MFKKLTKASLFAATAGLLLAACGNDDTATETDQSDGENSDATQQLVVYSNSLSQGRSEWLEEQAAEAGFELSFIDGGGGEIFNRLLAEQGSPQADITYGMDEGMFLNLANEDILVEYTPEWAADIPAQYLVDSGLYHPLVEQRIFMTYNAEYISEDEAPKNWQDLASNPDFEGKYRVPADLGGGTNQKAAMSILLQYQDENGDLGIADEGWEELSKWFENGYVPQEGESTDELFAEGSLPINFVYSSGVPAAEDEFGYTATPIDPEMGVFSMAEQIGIVNKGEDHDYTAAQDFVDWFGSAEIQGEWAAEFGTFPVHPDAQPHASERINEIMASTHVMEVDWDFINEYLDLWVEKVELEILP